MARANPTIENVFFMLNGIEHRGQIQFIKGTNCLRVLSTGIGEWSVAELPWEAVKMLADQVD